MSQDLIRVVAQYYDENNRPKGGQEFYFYADADDFMYADSDKVASAIQSMIDQQFGRFGDRFEYRSHEILFVAPIELTASFDRAIERAYAEVTK